MSRDDVLLIGGSGFIGRALTKRLEQDDITAHILGRNDLEQLEGVLSCCGTVIHLASATPPGSSAHDASLELDNLVLTLRLREQMKKRQEIHLIFFSSGGTVYGNPDWLPVTEDNPIRPLSNYGAGKVSQEAFCLSLRACGNPITILRPSNVYGPSQTMRHGFGLVRTMLENIWLGKPLEIWGDRENIRDYIYIDDVVEATLRLIKYPQDSGAYNLGSGIGHSINQVRRIVGQVTGKELNITTQPARSMDVRAIVLDMLCLEKRLSWKPQVGLEEGVLRTWRSIDQS